MIVKLSAESSYFVMILSSPIVFFIVVSVSSNTMASFFLILDFMEPFQSKLNLHITMTLHFSINAEFT